MDIWEKLYERAKKEYDPKEVNTLYLRSSCRMCFRSRKRRDLYRFLHRIMLRGDGSVC